MNWIAVKDKEPEKGRWYRVFGRCWIRDKGWSLWSQGDAYYGGDGKWLHEWYYPNVQISHYMIIPNPKIDNSYDSCDTNCGKFDDKIDIF